MMADEALVYLDDVIPGITRKEQRGHWLYLDADGKRITDRDEIDRLNRVGLPPAYRDAWFAPIANAHILATGIDARGRKQYRYHPDFQAQRDSLKFETCLAFGQALPRIRKQVERDLAGRALNRERAVASVVRLLDSGRIRVGSEAYVRANKSFGATTLRRRHAHLGRGRLDLSFKAKSGKQCRICITDRGLIRFARQVQDLPGQHLFQYRAEDGSVCPVGSGDVNRYIREAMGADFTAKHFRTWRASAIAFDWLAGSREGGLRAMLDFVAAELCNTPAIARRSYVHPALIELAKTADRPPLPLPRATRWLSRAERGLIDWLAQRD